MSNAKKAEVTAKPGKKLLVIGALEYCDLPDLGIKNLPVRVDTGAATSSLHVDNLQEFKDKGRRWASFDISPDVHKVKTLIHAKARIVSKRKVKSSSADTEKRVVITTTLSLGDRDWPIELTLTDRSAMTYLMLLGREAMAGRILVDPASEFLLSGK
jgi:hypothetical protein